MKKCAVLVIAAAVMLFMLLPMEAAAKNSATPLTEFEYTLQEDGSVLLEKYIGQNAVVTVPDSYRLEEKTCPVILASKTVFAENTSLTKVTVSPGVGFRENSMAALFYGCTGLRTAVLTGLDTADITNMSHVFSNCESLTRMEGYKKWDTRNVKSISFMFNMTKALQTVDLRSWDLSGLINSGWCFQMCGAQEILLPDSLAVISAGFLNHATNVWGNGFVIPAGVKQIGFAHTFYDFATGSFTEFYVDAGNTGYKTVDGILYSADGKQMLAIPRGKTFPDGVYEIPEGVEFLGELSFSRNYHIEKIILPDSYRLSFIEKYDPAYIIYNDMGNLNVGLNLHIAIYCYTGITQYAVKSTNPVYQSVEGVLYSRDMTSLVAVPTRYDRALRIPEGVITWEEGAMWCADVHALMKNCPGVSIPSTMLAISEDQINKLNRLESEHSGFNITVSPDNPNYHIDSQGQLRHKPMIGDMTISFQQDAFVYDGTPKEPLPEIRQEDRVLVLGEDYTLEYTDNINVGTGMVTITAKGEQTGSTQFQFTILPAEPAFCVPENITAVYGQQLGDIPLPAFFSWASPETPVGAVGDNTHYAVYWNEDPNYIQVDQVAVSVKVSTKTLQEESIWVRPLDFWSCSYIKPTVKITDGNLTVPREEYTVAYTNNFWCGRGTVTVTDHAGGSYAVSGEAHFWILPGPFFGVCLLLLLWLCTTGRVLHRAIKEADGQTGHDKTGQVSQQSSGDGVSGPANSGSTEVNTDGVEGGLCGTQHHSGSSSNQRVHPIARHQLRTNSEGCAAADGTDQHKNCSFRWNTKKPKDGRKKPAEHIHSTGGPEHTDSSEQQNQGRG